MSALVMLALLASARVDAAPAENPAAKAAFLEGERSFQLGKFEAAIEAYERAFGLDPQPAFLFNIALSQRRQYEIDGDIERLARARELYRNYLKLEPRSAHRAGVERLIAELTAKVDLARGRSEAPAPAPAPVSSPVAAARAPAPAAPVPPLVAAGGATAAAAPATVLVGPARPDEAPRPGRKWVIGGTIAAAAVVAAATILFVLVTRDGPSFDGPAVVVTPSMP